MRYSTIMFLLTILFSSLPASADELPMLPTTGITQLPSIDSATISMVDQDQNISVTCFLGNPNDRNSLGDIMVNGAGTAGATCNSLYFSCKGRCFACFSDFDLSQDICVDNSGRKFLK
jgi:hypothetical protein